MDRNLWGVSLYLGSLTDPWQEAPPEAFVLTRPPERAPDEPAVITIGFASNLKRAEVAASDHCAGKSDSECEIRRSDSRV